MLDENPTPNPPEPTGTPNPEPTKEDPAKHFVSSPVIEAAKAENDRKALMIEEEKKLMSRREKLHAEQMVGGHTVAGQQGAPELTPEQKKINNAVEFFAGTGLADDIKRANG